MNTPTTSPVKEILVQTLASCDECLNRGDLTAAWQALCWAVSLAPDSTDLLVHRGRLALILDNAESAQRDFAEALRIWPGCSGALTGLARCHLKRGELVEAEVTADRALCLDPADEEAAKVKADALAERTTGLPQAANPKSAPLAVPTAETTRKKCREMVTLISNGHPLREISIKSLVGYLEAKGVPCRSVYLDSASALTPGQCQKVLDICEGSTLVGFSLMSKDVKTAVPLTWALRNRGTPVVWGGIHPTAMPEESLKHCDFACIGEGELTLLRLYRALMEGSTDYASIPNLAYAAGAQPILPKTFHSEPSLDDLPFPDYRFFDAYMLCGDGQLREVPPSPEARESFFGMSTFLFYSQRGCPLSCSYCSNSLYHTLAKTTHVRWYRTASPARVKEEIRHHLKYVNVRELLWINDDDFMSRPLKEIEEISQFLGSELGLRFNINATPSVVNRDKMAVLAKHGLRQIAMGVQSGSLRILKDVYHRRVTPEHVIKAANIISESYKSGVIADYGFILENPYENRDDDRDSIKLFLALPKPFTVSLYSLAFFPGTKLTTKALEEQVITRDKISLDKDYRDSIQPSIVHLLFEANYNFPVPAEINQILLSDEVLVSENARYVRLLLSNYFLSEAVKELVGRGPKIGDIGAQAERVGSGDEDETGAFVSAVQEILRHWSAPLDTRIPIGTNEDLVLRYADPAGVVSDSVIEIGLCKNRIVRVGDQPFNPARPANALNRSSRKRIVRSPERLLHREAGAMESGFPARENAAPERKGSNEASWTFGIVTNGQRNIWVDELIASILNQNIEEFEIIVCGAYENARMYPITHLSFEGDENRGWITRKKNMIISRASKHNLCLLHDRMRLDSEWYKGIKRFGTDFVLQYCQVLSIDRQTVHNSATVAIAEQGKVVMCNLPNGIKQQGMWIDGAQIIGKTRALKENPLNEELLIGEGEDVEWSRRVIAKGLEFKFNPHSHLLNKGKKKVQVDYVESMRIVTHPSASPGLFREMLISASERWGLGKRTREEILGADRQIAKISGGLLMELKDMRTLVHQEPHFALWHGLVLEENGDVARAFDEYVAAVRLGLDDWRMLHHIERMEAVFRRKFENGRNFSAAAGTTARSEQDTGLSYPLVRPPTDLTSGIDNSRRGKAGGMEDANADFSKRWRMMQAVYRGLLQQLDEDGIGKYDPSFVHSSWKEVSEAIMNLLTGEPNRKLFEHPVIRGVMVREGFSISQEYEVAYLKNCLRPETYEKIASFEESPFGNLRRECEEFHCSTNTLGHLFYAAKSHELFDSVQFKVIVEFGGGYGNLAMIFKHLHPQATIIVIDLPEMLALQYLFLRSSAVGAEVVIHGGRNLSIQSGAINLIPVFYIDALKERADLFISTFGLSETPLAMQRKLGRMKFFSANNVYIAGQLAGASNEHSWVEPASLHDEVRKQYRRVNVLPFHVFQNGVKLYEISASGASPENEEPRLAANLEPAVTSHVPITFSTGAPTVSIFIPTYNREEYLSATLDSLLGQTFGDFEIIIADDGSTDHTLTVARSYAQRDSRIRVLALPHRGEVAARNDAIIATHQGSRFLMNHDSDDLSLPAKLSRLVAYLEKEPNIGAVGCFAEYFDDTDKPLGRPPLEHDPARIRATFSELNSMVNSAALIRRAVFAKVGPYREPFRSVDDYDFFARALLAGFELANVPEVLHRIRLHPSSVGSTRAQEQQELAAVIRAAFLAGKVAERVTPPEARRQKCTGASTSLNILHTVEFYAPHTGGAEAVVQQLSERLVRRGHRVTVATTMLLERPFCELNGVGITEFAVAGKQAEGITGEFRRYQQFLREFDGDLMMNYAAQQWATDLAMPLLPELRVRRANVIAPCGYSALADVRTVRWPQFHNYFQSFLPKALRLYDAAVYHSAIYKDFEFSRLLGLKNGIVIPNGTDSDEFTRPLTVNFREKNGITTRHIGLCVANFMPGKGQERVIECVRQMNRPDFTMIFIGKEGTQLLALQQQAKGLNVRFLAGIQREETVAAFRSTDLFLFASHIEASPLVIIEAKAARLPFVSTDCGNVREWKGGIVCGPGEMAALAARLLDDPARRRQLAEEGWREWKDRLTWEAVVDQWEELYLRLHAAKDGTRRTVSALPAKSAALVTGVIFSKDRPLQLDGTIRSFLARCQDSNQGRLKVLYCASAEYQPLYDTLIQDFPMVEFVPEKDFRDDLLSMGFGTDHILFMVDDNIFIRDFTLAEVIEALRECPAALGFSLRLGHNTTFCYPLNRPQCLPPFETLSPRVLSYNWTNADGDFNYPLEVSSSVYRTAELLPLLRELPFKNPNTLEGELAARASRQAGRPQLLCFEASHAFCNPVNMVQRICQNRAGGLADHSPERLAQQFRAGARLDVEAYKDFTPTGCHQEVPLQLSRATLPTTPAVSIVIPCYKQAHYLPEAVRSVLAQTFTDWELIIVNDGSPDNTSEVANQWIKASPDRRISLVEQPNGGLPSARNAGFRAARGEYVLPLDADDKLKPNLLEKLVSILDQNPRVGFAYGHIQHFGAVDSEFPLPDFDRDTLISEDNICCVCSLVRKSAWQQAGGYNEAMREGYEDWDFWIACVEKGWAGFCIHEPLFCYRKSAQSMLSAANQKRERLIATIICNHPKLYDAKRQVWAGEILRKFAAEASAASPATQSSRPLRITYLVSSILGVTGGNQTLLGHVNGLVARGHDVTIVTGTPKPAHTPIQARVIQVPAGHRMSDCVPESDMVVATYFINAVELASIKAPVKVYYAQGDQYVFADTALKGGQHEQLRKLSDLSYQMEDVFFLPNSANLAQAVRARTRRLPDAVLPVMVNRAVFKPTPRDNTPETWRILIVGPDSRGSESEPLTFKGIGDIREALRLLGQRTPNFQVLRMSSTSPDLFADFPCEFHQAPPSALKTRLYGSADILIYASHYDSCPRPPLEAMSAGCALVCTDTAGAREYCQDGVNCRLVPIKSPQAIADAVWEIMTTATLRQRIVQGGFTTAERLDERQEIDVLEKLLLQFRSDALAGKRAVGFEKQTAKRLPPRMPASITLPRVAQIGQLTKAQELWRKKSPRLAWEATREAIQVRPHHPEAFLLLAEIARMVGDSSSARSCAQHALRLAPAFKPARKFLQGSFHGKTKPDWLVLPNPIGDSNGAKRIRLSVCLIVKNEERFLDQCLVSVRDVADQIVVVDTGSTDRTIEIARTHGAEVHAFAWCDDFSAARNAALEHATGEWVLALDADEELPPDQHDALRRMLDRASIMGWRLPLVDVGREENGHHYVPRLFRNAPGLFYVGRVHEQVFYSVEARRKEWGLENELGDALLRHHGYTEEVMKERGKVERNLRLLEVAVTEITDDPMLVMNYGLELIRSGRFDAGLHQYRAAFEMMSKLPASAVVLDSREALLTHFCTHLLTAKRPLEVLSVLSSPLARNGGLTASLHYLLGVAHMELQQFADAAQQLRHCLAQRARPTLTPANREVRKVTPRHYLARCLWLAQELEEAEREFEIAITEAPEAVNVQIDYARCLHEHGKTADALQLLNRCTTANAGVAAAWVAGGQIALSQPGLLEVATDWTQVAIAHHPDDVTLSAQRAEALMLSGQLEAALPCWIKAGDATGARAIAARILCEIVVGADVIAPPPATLSVAVSREFGRWYWQLVEFGAESAVVQLHAHVAELGQVLPDAAEVLRSVIDRLAVAEAV
jgi:glycosyltransferase involved in cell wall biosynthesis/radical SAM superfamily enzyme YgiQ (UPF0313 family)/Tfp pilus assembly protein PilF